MGKKRKRAAPSAQDEATLESVYYDNLKSPGSPTAVPNSTDTSAAGSPAPPESPASGPNLPLNVPEKSGPTINGSENASEATGSGEEAKEAGYNEEEHDVITISSESDVIEILDSEPDHSDDDTPVDDDNLEIVSDDSDLVTEVTVEPEPAQRQASDLLKMRAPVEVTINCEIPGHEKTTVSKWGANVPFYSLENEFGRDSVLVYKDTAIKKFQTPHRIDSQANKLELRILTDFQWKQLQLKGSASPPSEASESEEEQEKSNKSESGDDDGDKEGHFPITLDGKAGQLRVLVSSASLIGDLVKHYLTSKQMDASSPVTVKFDGDTLGFSDTVGSVDMEEDDKLDLHVH